LYRGAFAANCQHLIHIPPLPGRTAEYNPESGKTWATFVSSGNAPPPKGISVRHPANRPAPPDKLPDLSVQTETNCLMKPRQESKL